MIPKRREDLRSRSDEMSLGHDPDLIARYLAGEHVTEQLREMEEGARSVRNGSQSSATPSSVAKLGIDAKQYGHLEKASSPGRATPRRPTLALIALAVALAMFAFSIWIALR